MCSFMGTTPAAKTRSFCLLFVLHTAHVLNRTIMVALLVVTQGWFAAVYLGSDLLVYLVSKAARRDILFWMPNAGIPPSLLWRFASKVFTDSTACVDFRHPVELGGLYYTLNAAMGQVPPIRVKRALRCCVGSAPCGDDAGGSARLGRALHGVLCRWGEGRGHHAVRRG
jgi:hypothetical protein